MKTHTERDEIRCSKAQFKFMRRLAKRNKRSVSAQYRALIDEAMEKEND